MANPQVLNTNANVNGKTLMAAENAETVTGLKTFDRDPAAPFAVSASSAVVSNLDADKVDGEHASALHSLANATNWATASLTFSNWTPTFSNVTLGNGTVSGRYIQIGKYVFYTAVLTLGSTSSITGGIGLNYPVNAVASSAITGDVTLRDASAGFFYRAMAFLVSSTSQTILCDNSAAGGPLQGVTATVPFTWAVGDQVFVTGCYEAA